MGKGLRRIRGAIGMGLTWALGWAVAGVLIGVASIVLPGLPWDTFFAVFDAPLPALAVPGFFAGMFFSIVLGIAGRRRTFRELSLPRFAAWGAVGGLLLTAFPLVLIKVGLATAEGSGVPWRSIAVIGGPFVILSALSAAVTLTVARMSERRQQRDLDGEADAVTAGGKAHEYLEPGASSHVSAAAFVRPPGVKR